MLGDDVSVAQLRITSGHCKVRMPEQLLQAENVAAVTQIRDGERVAEIVNCSPHARYSRLHESGVLTAKTEAHLPRLIGDFEFKKRSGRGGEI